MLSSSSTRRKSQKPNIDSTTVINNITGAINKRMSNLLGDDDDTKTLKHTLIAALQNWPTKNIGGN